MEHASLTRRLIAGLFLAGAALALPASAAASFDFSQIDLKASNGYTVRIVGDNYPYPYGAPGSFVGLTTHKNHAYTSYDTGGVSTAKHLQADLSPFGSIDVTFHPKSTTLKPLNGPHCTGKYKQTDGVWKGSIDFKGENGYTKLHVKSADGKHVVNTEKCQGGSTKHSYVELLAQYGGPTGSQFSADLRKKAGAEPSFSVFIPQYGPLSIFRTAEVKGKRSMFDFASNFSSATIKPPSPFGGTGTYSSGVLSGSLSVDLPGAPNTPIGPWAATLGNIKAKH